MSVGDRALRVLSVTGGHRVDLDAFGAMLSELAAERGWILAHAVQPDAQRWFDADRHGSFDAILCHDVPGLDLHRGTVPTPRGPEPDVARAAVDLLDAGQGIVFLHHALAGWPGWPDWAEVLGGRYHYAPGRLRGRAWPDSGFRHAEYTARVVDATHPVCAGVTDFTLRDELYCCPVFTDDVIALLRADAPAGPFRETLSEVLGTGVSTPPWEHPPASDLIGWAKVAGSSPVVYLQPGDGPDTFADVQFRRLLGNAIDWVASPAAHAWARRHPRPISPPPPHPDNRTDNGET